MPLILLKRAKEENWLSYLDACMKKFLLKKENFSYLYVYVSKVKQNLSYLYVSERLIKGKSLYLYERLKKEKLSYLYAHIRN